MGSFIDADLVDTIEIAIIPIVLGAGIRLFDPGLPTRRFDLRSVEQAAAGYALLKMARKQADAAQD